MAQESQARNPFMLMIEPEVVLAAIENSERLGRLNRHLCRPLDRQVLGAAGTAVSVRDDDGESEFDPDDTH